MPSSINAPKLGLLIQSTPTGVRLYDPKSEQYLLMPAEVEKARREAEAKMAQMQAEIERLRALLAQKES